ncbi:MAG: CooT family nickel-binding protein [Nitrospiraceae bacterium]|jgi:predicted RNA-binding protein|nr:MAG: CooT family nickel-binding protein [Nitrospiraceae bacterium]
MCEANAYIFENGKEELYLENVDIMKPEEGKIFLKNLFGEQKIFEGEIKEISLLRHKIVLQKR